MSSTTERQAAQMRSGTRTVAEAEAGVEKAIAEMERRRPQVETGDRRGQAKRKPTTTEVQAASMLGRTAP
ncbi:hypothetical protein GCM10009623_08400 [Nocardioides aestuarii]|uniref:DUF3618 domain-containing protein n=1 Tax=Nocardioides aestuarii TaxID=252231 RepID=A0ABW4TH20_9ACTN